MSSADRFLNKKPFLGHLITLVIGLIIALSTYALNKSDLKAAELNAKADLEYVDKADDDLKDYVDDRFEQHILVDQRAYKNLENIIILNMNEVKAILVGFEKYTQSIDKRLERIEDKN